MTQFSKLAVSMLIALFVGSLAACAPTAERRGTGEVVDDAGLTARVKTALLKAEGLTNAAAINVNTYRGEVQLSGFVDTQAMIDRAGEAARNVQGVTAVRNDLRIGARR